MAELLLRKALRLRERIEALRAALLGEADVRAAVANRIAHSYGDLDVRRLVTEMPTGLDHLERFLQEITPAFIAPA